MGRQYYTCMVGGCAMLKWWDDAVMEEVQELKMEKDNLEDRVWYINTDSRGKVIDPRIMWINVLYTQDDVNRLHLLSQAGEENYEELKLKVEELGRQDLRLEVHKSVMAVKKMKILTIIAVLVALVALVFLLFK